MPSILDVYILIIYQKISELFQNVLNSFCQLELSIVLMTI